MGCLRTVISKAMKALNVHPLSDDILDRVLTLLSDFESLRATILSSKAAYAVFTARPQSIIRAVAQNLLGPALLSAIHLIRNIPPGASYAEPYKYVRARASGADGNRVDHRRRCAQALSERRRREHIPHIYSLQHKDRSTKSNKLTAVESFRFIRALYRIMLFADVFLGSYTPGLHHNVEPEDVTTYHLARRTFFTVFPTQDLLEIGTVGFFIGDLGRWLKRKGFNTKNPKNHPGQGNVVPPASLLPYHKLDPHWQMIDDYFATAHLWAANPWRLFDNYIHGPLGTVLRDRGELDPWAHPLCSPYILGYVEGQDDLCQRCGANAGIELWTESNWELQNDANLAFRPFDLEQLRMRGFLNKDPRERDAWLVHIKAMSLHELFHDLFEVKTADYATLNPQEKTCKPCLTRFIDVHTHLCLLQRKRRAGEYIPEDCGRGYRCREQFRNRNHAVEFNHLCAPS
ncbi:hypothetical protein C8R46DRAFT_1141429 [Mycena filopes]|nr:hypothetical protein C8R46DRAFT_1141429 [Mycena filopes]